MRAWRVALASSGLLLGGFGVFRLLTEIPIDDLLVLGGWLVAAVAAHDALVAPAVVGVGWLLGRTMAPRSRRYLQGGLLAAGLITVVAVPMIVRAGREPPSKALLQQDVSANLVVLLGVVAGVSLSLYAVRALRDNRAPVAVRQQADAPDE